MSMTTTTIDLGELAIGPGAEHHDELLTASGAATFAKGTILARLAATGKLVPFEPGGAGGAEVPLALLPYPVDAAGAGDVPIRALHAGRVNAGRLVIHADGDGSNVTVAILDQLRRFQFVGRTVQQLSAG